MRFLTRIDIFVFFRYHIKLMLWFLCFGFSNPVSAELVLSAPPREAEQAGVKLYGPLATHLSQLLGEKVSYEHPKNWLQYQRDLRRGRYDIVFDGPHFISWRQEHLKHEVLVKLPGALEFVVAVDNGDTIQSVKELVGKKVCGIPPPNLATLTVIDLFKNPVRQPVIWGVPGGFKKVLLAFEAKQCRAAVFRTNFYMKLPKHKREKMRVLYKSSPLPNQGISVSTKVSNENKKRIIRSLTVGEGKVAARKISSRFAGDKSFVAARKEDYSLYNLLLEGVVYGW
ncbi:MAG: phosphate/phosphite/phosphonate ABC transporter substrate-binding protein [Gammaproteobacteria bacterium]|nr:phosphate/phosphite/phosphonate ABC transporter substrate-binding protein [Gammaproteobacteria bacterium]MDH5802430.1 phosphate/phosphite/phosphonate ABC transporter substrate-binding protein [Gammaproteobacteria bacterium]